jgi:hypothetical protein
MRGPAHLPSNYTEIKFESLTLMRRAPSFEADFDSPKGALLPTPCGSGERFWKEVGGASEIRILVTLSSASARSRGRSRALITMSRCLSPPEFVGIRSV